MRRILLTTCLLVGMAGSALAQDAAEVPIQKVIRDQISALQADDYGQAFTYASPMIKGIFGTPENFGKMVREGYPMVWRPSSVQMLELREVAGGLWQRVLVTDAQGRGHVLEYQMVETPEGWQINAVQLLPAPGTGA
jgi:hypothetical protein